MYYIYYTHTLTEKYGKMYRGAGKYAGKEWEDGFPGKIICTKT